ncbi:hypothetical protein Tco_0400029 [Tanacetum coccineum]
MTSFDYRLNLIYAIKECSTCGVLYTADFCCSKKGLEDKILVPKPPRNFSRCARCGTLVDGPYCQGCSLLRKKFKEDLFTYCVENEFFKDLQDTSESSDDNTNVVNAPQEPFVGNQDPGENSSPSPPHIDHCCHECGDSLDGIFCRQCTCKSCGKGAHYGYNCPPKEKKKKRIAEEQAAKDRYWRIPNCYDDDEDYTIAITPVLPTKEPVNSLSMGDEHLDTIPATESDKLSKNILRLSSIPTDDSTSSDDDSYENIDYVDASPPNDEIVSLEVVEIVDPEVGRIDDDILLTIKDDILREKLLNVNLLIAKIDSLRDNPTPSSDVMTKSSSTSPNLFLEETNTFDNSSPEAETFCFDLEEISSGSPTTHSDYSLPDYEAFYSDDDHIKEKNSDSTTTHANFSKYVSFIFDLSINPFPRGGLGSGFPECEDSSVLAVYTRVYHPQPSFLGILNEYLRKGRKTKPKRQNRTRNGKARKRQSQSPSPSLKKSTESQPKSTPKPKSQLREAAIGISWTDFKALLVEEFCPSNEMEKLESEF